MESDGFGGASAVSPSCNLSFFSFFWFWPLQPVDSRPLRLPQKPLPSWNGYTGSIRTHATRKSSEFTRETGIHVKVLPSPEGPVEQLAMWKKSS